MPVECQDNVVLDWPAGCPEGKDFMSDIAIDNMLADFGVAHSEFEQAHAALFEWGVIQRRHRVNIARSKCGQAREVLELVFLWHCNNGECRQAAREEIDDAGDVGLAPLLVQQSACEICGGSPGARSLERMAAALADAGVSRILIVGGTERKYRELDQKSKGTIIEWRFVDGTVARDDRYYQPKRDWAHIIVIWQSTPLDHRVSAHFDGKGDERVITVRRRGVAALAGEVVRHLTGS